MDCRFAWKSLFWAMFLAGISSAEDQSSAPEDKMSNVLVTISKETTYITEPLRPDGYPDYIAALNQHYSKDVTPENNSAVLFWKAMGPSEINAEDREQYFQMLGIPPLPEKGEYFITSEKWFNRMKASMKAEGRYVEPTAPEDDDGLYRNPYWDQIDTITGRPWSKDELPLWDEWLETNEKPLALLIEASNRPRRYDPMLGASVVGIEFYAIQLHREVCRILVARAMLKIHEGKPIEAWKDLLACHRFARLAGQGPILVDLLVGRVIEHTAAVGDLALLKNQTMTSSQICLWLGLSRSVSGGEGRRAVLAKANARSS